MRLHLILGIETTILYGKHCLQFNCMLFTKVKCLHCTSEFDKRTSQLRKSDNHFCSRSCSASFFNKRNPKRPRKECQCKRCGQNTGYTWRDKRTVCDACLANKKTTKKDYVDQLPYQVHGQIRREARSIYAKSDRPKHCVICGYSKHYHVCHVKAIKDFPPEALLKEINHKTNLVALCPNHHWEFDNGHMPVEVIRKFVPSAGLEPALSTPITDSRLEDDLGYEGVVM